MAKQVARKAKKRSYPAPYALISTWQRFGGKGLQARLDAERRAVVKLAGTPTARNLIRIFFLTERLKALGKGDAGIARVHVVGAGVMGGDIAAWAAYKGFEVTLQDREQRFIDAAMTRAQVLFDKKVKDPTKRPAVAARLQLRPGRRWRGAGRPGDRGDHRESRRQARAVRNRRAAAEARMRC
jgi:3-hydroxyacyl-CoA dehydrogenase/enoyl-CoA hydratase/3-hydroxybutyryl-CoA epimerase